MSRIAQVTAALLLFAVGPTHVLLRAQPGALRPSFEIASVKLNKSADQANSNFPLGPGDVYSSNGGRFSARGLPLVSYLFFAYKITGDQSQAVLSQLPGWASTDRFDIEAKTDGDPAKDTKDQMRLMMQSLLADRFGLQARYETKQVPVFALTLAKPGKTGPQLRAHAADAPCSSAIPSDATGFAATVDGGFPTLCGGFLGMPPSMPGRMRAGARNVTIEFIGKHLIANFLNRPVIDRTGLSGTFDVVMEWTPEANGPPGAGGDFQPDPTGPTFLEALSEQLGLKAESQKGPAEVLVIDHVDHPSEN
jgi:uncharacterized protein (TIGR03435 family)